MAARQNRRVEAREQLRDAYAMFASMGGEGCADRARRELPATGETVRKRRDDTRDEVTPQEEQIATLARDGRTNPEIGAELFISPRTVEWHLRKVFTKLGITALSKSIALDMKRYNVRSNCIAPFAWSRMTSSIPANSPEQQARLEKIKQMTPDKNAPMAVFLASDAAKDVSGQVFGTRMNELILFSSPRPIRYVHRAEGWTPEAIAEHALPALKPSFMPLDRSGDVFSWDPL